MPPRKRAETAVDVQDPSYDGVPTVVVHIDAEPEPSSGDVDTDLPVVTVPVETAETEGS